MFVCTVHSHWTGHVLAIGSMVPKVNSVNMFSFVKAKQNLYTILTSTIITIEQVRNFQNYQKKIHNFQAIESIYLIATGKVRTTLLPLTQFKAIIPPTIFTLNEK